MGERWRGERWDGCRRESVLRHVGECYWWRVRSKTWEVECRRTGLNIGSHLLDFNCRGLQLDWIM